MESCQNFCASAPDAFDDGGFFFALDDPIRNKAGAAGRDAAGCVRFHAYGSATCDGWLALRACGLIPEHPRLRAAAEWLRKNERAAHPGAWRPGRESAGEALVFYYAQALAAVLAELAARENWAAARRRAWHAALLSQQARDGSWAGLAPESCEDDPLLATAFALRALTCL